jgi:hypothetical protein
MNYYEIPNKSVIAKELLEFAKKPQSWEYYYNFKVIQAPVEILVQDPFLTELFRAHQFKAGIIQLNPYVCYDWHIDSRRGVGVNMLLNAEIKSNCLFAKDEGVQFKFEELPYKHNTYYLFNTQVRHTVINFDQPRYLFTIEFLEDKDQLSFNNLLIQKNPTL